MLKIHSFNSEKLCYSLKNGQQIFNAENLVSLIADRNYTTLNILYQKPIVSSYTLKSFQRILPEELFIRISQSSIINIMFFQELIKGNVIMKNNQKIKISRRRLKEVKTKLKKK
jgi:two-component system, LytTR family, response regulator